MIRTFSIFLLSLLTCFQSIYGQERTVGLLSYQPDLAFDGLNLFFPHGQSTVYLIDNCGDIVNTWEGNPDHVPGNSVYLNENGNLLRASRYFDRTGDPIWAGGGGAFIDALDWDGNILWSFELNNDTARIHHDFEVLPNGNILMIAWEKIEGAIVIENGRDSLNLPQNELWPDFVFEYSPASDSIVWEWHAWDHLIQDFDNSKLNFGVVAEHPEKIDINFETNGGLPDWMHSNSIDYNPDLDQIMLSVPHFNEVWIIDHSTTSEEASGSTGGNSGKGGDLLYRWGNPAAYGKGSEDEQKLFFQHDAQWIRDYISEDNELFDQILVFNNRAGDDYSTVNVINQNYNIEAANYQSQDGLFLPQIFDRVLDHPLLRTFYSSGLSSAQYLPNGNLLILSGRYGYAFEITENDEVVWEYRVPLISGQAVEQGQLPIVNENLTFRMKRYPLDYPGFSNKDLTKKGSIQLSDIEEICDKVVSNKEVDGKSSVYLYPNPVNNHLNIRFSDALDRTYSIFNTSGYEVLKGRLSSDLSKIDVSSLATGMYYIILPNAEVKSFVKATFEE